MRSARGWRGQRSRPRQREAVAENPVAPKKAKAAYSTPLCQYIARHKTAAVAEMLLASPRAAQEVMAVLSLKTLSLHGAFAQMAKETEPSTSYRVVKGQARCFAAKLGFTIEEGESVWDSFPPPFSSELALYEAVRGLRQISQFGLSSAAETASVERNYRLHEQGGRGRLIP